MTYKLSIFLLIFSVYTGLGFSQKSEKTGKNQKQNLAGEKLVLSVLPLINLQNGKPLTKLTDVFRLKLKSVPYLKVMDEQTQNQKLEEYGKDPGEGCNSKECSFEIGGLLQTNFVLFGTASKFESIHMITVKILNVQTTRIVWSRALTSASDASSVVATFNKMENELSKIKLNDIKKTSEEILAVIDFSDDSYLSKIMFERILTHAYKYGFADVMSNEEVDAMMEALDIKKDTVLNSIETILKIGDNLGVQGVLYTQLAQRGVNLKHQIALFDITEKSVVLSMPPLPSGKFTDILFMERHFFSGLGTLEDRKAAKNQK